MSSFLPNRSIISTIKSFWEISRELLNSFSCCSIFFLISRYIPLWLLRAGYSVGRVPPNWRATMWRNSTPLFAWTLDRRNENIKYFISSRENRTHNLSRLQSHACAPAPRLAVSNFHNLNIKTYQSKIWQNIVCEEALS